MRMTTLIGPDRPLRPPKVARPSAAPRVPSPLIGRFAATLAVAPANRKSAKIQAFWAHAAARGTPLSEPSSSAGQQIVTFLWRAPIADQPVSVYLFVNRLTDERELGRSSMSLLPGTDIWHLSYQLDDDWRASYCFCPVDTERADRSLTGMDQIGVRRWLDSGTPDPLNPDRVRGRGGRQMSMVSLSAAPPQPWLNARPGTAVGTVRSLQVPAITGFTGRTVWVYEPARRSGTGSTAGTPAQTGVPPTRGHGKDTGDDDDFPVVLLLDGEVWLHSVGITSTMDNLIAAGRIPPIRLVLPDSLGTTTRWRELTARPDVIDALADHLLQAVGVRSAPRHTAIAGNSLGGLTAIAAVMLRPDRFGHAISMSGSTWWHPEDSQTPMLEQWATSRGTGGRRGSAEAAGEGVAGYAAGKDTAPPTGTIELQLGRQEWVLDRPTRAVTSALRAAGWQAELVEFNGGHDYACWQGSFADALIRWADRLGQP